MEKIKKEEGSMKDTEQYTLITGASMGLGKCLAEECAKRGHHLILIALSSEGIAKTALQLSKKYHINAIGCETDLTKEQNVHSLSDWLLANFNINFLINNAGIGGTEYFEKASVKYFQNIIQLNMSALVLLTHQLLPVLKQQPNSHILNISSMAAFGPMAFKTIYPASKAFVSSFSRGLNSELNGTNVSVSVAHPGGMATNADVSRRMEQYSKMVQSTYMSPEETARICIEQTIAKKTIIVPGLVNKINRFAFKWFPEKLRLQILANGARKEMAEMISS